MADNSKIEWTDATWNPVRGCSRVSEGCRNCYAERVAARFSDSDQAYEGLATRTASGPRWTGKVRLIEEHLEDPIRWKKPRRIFVNSMSDLFHEGLSDEQIDKVFAVMALCPQHTFQVLTKRAERMRDYLNGVNYQARHFQVEPLRLDGPEARRSDIRCEIVAIGGREGYNRIEGLKWPLPNVHLGVSAEDQKTANERLPELLATPAAVRWVSYEPALGPVSFRNYFYTEGEWDTLEHRQAFTTRSRLDWIVVGGESGPGARPFDALWARNTIAQCKVAGVSCFVKQLGARPFEGELIKSNGLGVLCDSPGPTHHLESGTWLNLKDKKGGDWNEWPEDLRVREFPNRQIVDG